MAAAIVLPAGLFFSVAADLPHIFLLIVLLAAGVFFRKKPLPLSDRSVIYLTLSCLVLTVLFDQMFPLRNDRFSFLAQLIHPEWIVPVLCYGAVLSALFAKRELTLGLAASAALAALSFGGDIQNRSARLQRLPEAAWLLGQLRFWYPVLLILTLWCVLYFLIAPRRRRIRWELGLLLLIPLAVLGMYAAYSKYETQVRSFENYLFRVGMRRAHHFGSSGRIFGSDKVNLYATLDPRLRGNEAQVVIEAAGAKAPPGYLRGRIYSLYGRGSWGNRSPEAVRELARGEAGAISGTHIFSLTEPVPPAERRGEYFELFVARNFQTSLLFHPAGADCFEAVADRVQLEGPGTLRFREWERSGGLRIYLGTGTRHDAETGKDPDFLQLPGRLSTQLRPILESAGADASQPFSEKTGALLRFFSANFRYSLEGFEAPEADPVIDFLTRRRAGHCEFFASALALLLREAGVPTRYVTGFLCEEPGVLRGSYVARLGNAHAWVEAFDAERGEWVTLEPTPPSDPIAGRPGESLRRYTDAGALLLAQLFAHLKRGTVAEWIWSAGSWLAELPWWCYIVLGTGGAATVVFLWRRRRRRGRESSSRTRLIRAYRNKLKLLRRAGLLERDAEPTAAELSKLLKDRSFEGRERLLRQLSIYRKLRYKAR